MNINYLPQRNYCTIMSIMSYNLMITIAKISKSSPRISQKLIFKFDR